MVRPDVRNEKNEMYGVQFKIDEKRTVLSMTIKKAKVRSKKHFSCFERSLGLGFSPIKNAVVSHGCLPHGRNAKISAEV